MTETAARSHVMKISCAESIHHAAILHTNNKHTDPMDFTPEMLAIEQRLTTCVNKSMELCKSTPCEKLVQDYMYCRNESRSNNCVPITDMIAECTAKHIGKLD